MAGTGRARRECLVVGRDVLFTASITAGGSIKGNQEEGRRKTKYII